MCEAAGENGSPEESSGGWNSIVGDQPLWSSELFARNLGIAALEAAKIAYLVPLEELVSGRFLNEQP